MNKKEKEARILCAFANWVSNCKDCPHREWPEGKWHKKPVFNWKKCQTWRYYLPKYKVPWIHVIRSILRL